MTRHGRQLQQAEALMKSLFPQTQIFFNRQMRRQRELLENGADAMSPGISDGGKSKFLAVHPNRSTALRLRSGNNGNQGGLASTVLTKYGMNLACKQLKIHPIQRAHTWKLLGQAFNGQ